MFITRETWVQTFIFKNDFKTLQRLLRLLRQRMFRRKHLKLPQRHQAPQVLQQHQQRLLWGGRIGRNGGHAHSHVILALEPGLEHMAPLGMRKIKSPRETPTHAVSNHKKYF